MDNPLQPDVVMPAPQVAPRASQSFNDYTAELIQESHLRNYWQIIKKRKRWFWGTFITVVVLVGLYTFLKTPVYRSSAILQIALDNTASLVSDRDPTGLSGLGSWYGSERFYETQFAILKSRPMAYRIIEALNLKEHPWFKKISQSNPQKSPMEIEGLMATVFLAGLEVKPYKKSYLVEVSYRSPDKYLAQQVPNAIYNEFVKFSMKTRHQSYKLIKEWLEEEIQNLARKVEASERRLYEHGQKKDFMALEGKDNVIVRKYTELSQLLTRAQSERALKEAQFKQIQEKGVDAPLIINNPLVQRLRQEKISQETKISGMSQIYDVNYPQMKAEQALLTQLNSRLKAEVNRLVTSAKADYEAALRAENLLAEAVEEQKAKVSQMQDHLVQHHILKRDLKTNEQLYQALLARMKEASIASTMVSGNVAVIAPAELPARPYSPSKPLNMILAVVLGLMGGVAAAFLRDYLDYTIQTTEEMERLCRLPALGTLPLASKNSQGFTKLEKQDLELATFKQPRSLMSEAVYHLRTALLLSLPGGPPGIIMVTSPNPDEGKTTVATNVATSLAMNHRKVVMVDCDLRKPSLNSIFQQPLVPGLSSFLTGSARKEEIVRPTFVPELSLVTAGPVPPNPVELLTSPLFLAFLAELRREFHHVVIDTPPILGFADGRAIAIHTDGVIVVLKHQGTTKESGRLALNLLAQVNAPILGGVLNMADWEKMGFGSYYGHYKRYAKYFPEGSDQPRLNS
jgi:capsular exopolysaccharide synthesis family protein|uniref:Polysaccharide biosynthesis tyrosine autokinase n=1 Tax=Desulfobacca acetoxidans TaxID=60893 RepID=A0A7C5EMF3_9BACT